MPNKEARQAPLPVRDGVAPSFLWLPEGSWPDIFSFLVERFPLVSAADWADRLARGEVVTADGIALRAGSQFRRGMRIFYYRELARETPIPFEEQVLFQDEHLVVVDKPHFLPMIPSGRFLQETLLVRLKKKLGLDDLSPIHRLDRETAGVVIFSSQQSSRGAYQSLFQRREVSKVYEALAAPLAGRAFPFVYRSRMVEGEPFFCMREVAGEANSETIVDVIEHRADATLYRLSPHTGRKHQLRVHMAALGVPIINDAFYPVALPCKADDVSQPLQLLARAIAFSDPLTGEPRRFESRRTL
ncbi:RluA family pseudouridine synthase [Janthinobacterium fluminis]|uniref:RluA family pseudouridine synthase n=1 Tax=Janthinobacterium fluminis TaxID=2987524 RepID=A0ABT5K6I0_9BURK|nr:RluA family pseudouridine synthase [Janthinobacterium fluminis]MDC8760599.1 RluA family pseudouridine synthase [Janthinobacterium fluminis]